MLSSVFTEETYFNWLHFTSWVNTLLSVWSIRCFTSWILARLLSRYFYHILWIAWRLMSIVGNQKEKLSSKDFDLRWITERDDVGQFPSSNFTFLCREYLGGGKSYYIPLRNHRDVEGLLWRHSLSIGWLFYALALSALLTETEEPSLILRLSCSPMICSDKLCLHLSAELVFHIEV